MTNPTLAGEVHAPVAAPPPRQAPGRALVVCDQWLGSNGYAGMKALRRAGWAVTVVPEWEVVPVRWRGAAMRAIGRALRGAAVRELERELVRQAERVRPEFLLVFKGTFVSASTLERLRRLGVRTYCFFPDVSFRAHGGYIPDALRAYDWVFTTKSFGLHDLREQLGVERASLLLHGFDPDLHRPVDISAYDHARYGCDASFIGTWSPKKERVLTELASRLPHLRLRVWGEQWEPALRGPLARAIGGHEVVGEEYVRAICASTINIALLSEQRPGASDGDRITSRTFHIPACGGFMLHERTDELLAVLDEDRSVACFGDAGELATQVERYLRDERGRHAIAAAGHARVSAAHGWDNRIRTILDLHVSHRA